MPFELVIPAFIAGFLTFIAPCTFPLVPGYLAFISGVSREELADPTKKRRLRRRIFLNGLLYVLGFSAVFIIFGTLIGFVGSAFVPYRIWLTRVGGIFVILFGLFMIDIFHIPFLGSGKQLRAPLLERGKPLGSFVLGSAFAFGWTPCVGPILGSILLLASTTATALKGALLLSIFSLGLGIPFLAIAAGIGASTAFIGKISRYLNILSKIGGVLLIFLGVLLLTNKMSLLIVWGYRIFRFINYGRLIDYL